MNLHSNKLGRNDPCFCGSGKKYKKCCLNVTNDDNATQEMAAFSKKMKDQYAEGEITLNETGENGMIKISEVIISLADELLESTQTFEEQEKALMLVIVAWNLSLLDQSNIKQEIDNFLKTMSLKKGSQAWKSVEDILKVLLQKKQDCYPSLKRFILNFEVVRQKDGFHLNVASSLVP